MSGQLHPAFEQADESHRWNGSLLDLWRDLKRRAAQRHDTKWVWAVLPHGAMVAARRREDWRYEVRISRSEKPADDKARAKWDAEIEVFLKHFPLVAGGQWGERFDDAEAKGVAVVVTELYRGEVDIGEGACIDCGVVVPWEASYQDGQRCHACAIRAGQKKVRA